jgi:hypothetical protein
MVAERISSNLDTIKEDLIITKPPLGRRRLFTKGA